MLVWATGSYCTKYRYAHFTLLHSSKKGDTSEINSHILDEFQKKKNIKKKKKTLLESWDSAQAPLDR